ncbi:MAG: hypothetical protein WBP88_11510 [Nitrososphaeraceae archaeon]
MILQYQNVQGITVPNSGHYISEERLGFVIKTLDNFFAAKKSHAIRMNGSPIQETV